MNYCNRLKDRFKPPIIVFFITIASLVVMLLTYAITLQIFDIKVLNPDAQNLKKLCKSISSLAACLENKNIGANIHSMNINHIYSNVKKSQDETTTAIFKADTTLIIDKIAQKNYFIEAFVNAEDIGFHKSDDVLKIIVSMPKPKDKNQKLTPACLSISGPSDMVPATTYPSCEHPKGPPKQNLTLMPTQKVTSKKFCVSGHIGNLIINEKDAIPIFLPEEEKKLMSIHIFAMVGILSVLFVVFLFYSVLKLFRRRNDRSHLIEEDLVPSPSNS